MKISKEQYDALDRNKTPGGNVDEKLAYDMGLIDDTAYWGYGVSGTKLYEKDGEYFFEYTMYKGGLD